MVVVKGDFADGSKRELPTYLALELKSVITWLEFWDLRSFWEAGVKQEQLSQECVSHFPCWDDLLISYKKTVFLLEIDT
jgi:hypothetical protein